MIVHVQITIRPTRYISTTKEAALKAASVEIEPEFLPCLNAGLLAEKLTARALKEYLARQAEVDEQEASE